MGCSGFLAHPTLGGAGHGPTLGDEGTTAQTAGPPPLKPHTWVFFPKSRTVVHHKTKIGGEGPLRALIRADSPRQALLRRATSPAHGGSVEEGPRTPLAEPRSRPAPEQPPPARGRDQAQARGAAQQGRSRRHADPPRLRAGARGTLGQRRGAPWDSGAGAGLGRPRQGDPAGRPRTHREGKTAETVKEIGNQLGTE